MLRLETVVVIDTTHATPSPFETTWPLKDNLSPVPLNVGALLAERGGVYIKQYGPGTLATPSINGGSASQTAVLWNGIPIQNAMLGLTDLALLPLHGASTLALEQVGNSVTHGSGAVSGSISLDSDPPEVGWHTRLGTSVGSFGHQQQQAEASWANEQHGASLSMQHLAADNDFPYRIREDLPERQQSNAAIQLTSIRQSYFSQKGIHRLSFHGWQQWANRQIPPLTTQQRSVAEQNDKGFRHVLHWRKTGNKAVWDTRLAHIQDQIHYADSLAGIDAPSRFSQLFGQAIRRRVTSKWSWMTGGQVTRATAETTNYSAPQVQWQAGIFSDYTRRMRIGDMVLGARVTHLVGTGWIPAFHWQFTKMAGSWHITLRAGHDFRIPGLNDLYWIPGGNPDLRPETAWSQQAGISRQTAYKRMNWHWNIAVFNRQTNHWIQWAQLEGQNFFSATNVGQVRSRGATLQVKWNWQVSKAVVSASMMANHTIATYQQEIRRPYFPKGAQLLYTPEWLANASVAYRRKQWQCRYTHRYSGAVEGINESLADWQLATLALAWSIPLRQHSLTLQATADNIWNTSYRVVERRPMPGRSYQINLFFYFTQIKFPQQ
ncbi:MAG: TonB-dependent receptor [Saprospiraceae bacterium]